VPAIAGAMAILSGAGVSWAANAYGWALAVHLLLVVLASSVAAATALLALDGKLRRELWPLLSTRAVVRTP
jgi:hypothetical protein